MSEVTEFYNFALEVAHYGGNKIKEGYYSQTVSSNLQSKADPCDLVTQYDQEIEREAIKMIKDKFPSHRIIGEESDAAGEKWSLTDDPTWIIDPIDGTSNFVHRFPFVCISIGVFVKKKPVVGVVFNPILNELFTAQVGKGAYLNQKQRLPIFDPTSAVVKSPRDCMVISEFGGLRDSASLLPKSSSMYKFAVAAQEGGLGCRGIRCLGSAALDLCQLAQGSADVYWEAGPYIWDIAAALLILKESGGFAISSASPNMTLDQAHKFDFLARTVLAVRSLAPVPSDRPRSQQENIAADSHALDILNMFKTHIESVPLKKHGSE
ncbi:hypothetical protein DSO57_1005065 [Entomophthora muscae]|uniref:Uncharacterized protein n=1 Tax=Entomophthora muscae TaxID=34485 RepID=A0ACC2UTG2_9FUNG|nr:hypothetical protein DSO57_1005065 [Entomophthora muscae]